MDRHDDFGCCVSRGQYHVMIQFLKHCWTPLSCHSLHIQSPSSWVISPSSSVLANANSCRASSYNNFKSRVHSENLAIVAVVIYY